MLTCKELIMFILDYLDGELPEAVRADFEKHLEMCPSCRAYLDSYLTTIRLARAVAPDAAVEPDQPMPDDLVKAILAAKPDA